MSFKFEETCLAQEDWYLVTAIIREARINGQPYPYRQLDYDAFVDQLYIGGKDEEEALTMAEIAFWDKYDLDPLYANVIFVGIEKI